MTHFVFEVRTFRRGDEVEIAAALLEDLAKYGELMMHGDEVFQYCASEGIWVPVPESLLRSALQQYAGMTLVVGASTRDLRLGNSQIRGSVSLAKDTLRRQSTRRFENAKRGLTFANVFICLEGGFSGQAHSPDQLSTYRYPFNYEATILAPKFFQVLDELFGDAPAQERQLRIACLQEFFGMALIGMGTFFQKVLVIYGAGANGKSTLVEILEAAFPPALVCHLPPQQFADRFRTEQLEGKLLNAANEIPESEIVSSNIFKSIVSGDAVTAERKHQGAFTFRPRAGHVFSANSLPAVADHSIGFWRRFSVVPFTRDLTTLTTFRPNVADEIIETELPGVVSWLIAGAIRAQSAGKLTVSQTGASLLGDWRRDADSVALFIDEDGWEIGVGQTTASNLYAKYSEWANRSGLKPVSDRKFRTRLEALGCVRQRASAHNFYPIQRK